MVTNDAKLVANDAKLTLKRMSTWLHRHDFAKFSLNRQCNDALDRPVDKKIPDRKNALDAHTSTPSFGVMPLTRKLDCSGMEPGRL
ncbi:hypothetical protein TNCV_289791 [Trichonephila clavipes]|nr:hypothetical protein TNCV_289791 [Trichonephila clavipes]